MTIPPVPSVLVGRNVSLAAVNGVVASSAGVLTIGVTGGVDSFSLKGLGVFESIEFEGNLELVDIHSADAITANYVAKYDDWTVTITAIDDATGGNPLADLYFNFNYINFRAQATAPAYGSGSSTAGKILSGIGIRSSIHKTYLEDKNATALVLKPCGIPVYWGTSGGAPY